MMDIEQKISARFDEMPFVVLDKMDPSDSRLRFIEQSISFEGEKVLDVGSGKGAMLEFLQAKGAIISGVDPSDAMLGISKARFPDADIRKGSATKIPFDDAVFDSVICSEVLEHVPDIEKAVDEVFRVLKPGGIVVIIDKNRRAYGWRLWHWFYWTVYRRQDVTMYPEGFGFEERMFAFGDITPLLEKWCGQETYTASLQTPFIAWVGVKGWSDDGLQTEE